MLVGSPQMILWTVLHPVTEGMGRFAVGSPPGDDSKRSGAWFSSTALFIVSVAH